MKFSTSYPYHRLTDRTAGRDGPVWTRGQSRTLTAVLVIGVLCIVVLLGTLGGLAALYVASLGPREGGGPTAPSLLDRVSELEREVSTLRALCRCRGEAGPIVDADGTGLELGRDGPQIASPTAVPTVQVASDRDFGDGLTDPDRTDVLAPDDRADIEGGTGGQGAIRGSAEEGRRRLRPVAVSAPPSTLGGTPSGAQPRRHRRLPRSKDRRGQRQSAPAERRDRGRQRDGADPEPDEAETETETEAEREPRRDRKKDRDEGVRRHKARNLRMSEPSPLRSAEDKESKCKHHDAPIAIHIQGMRDGNIFIENDGWIRGFGMWEVVDLIDNNAEYFSFSPHGVVTVVEGGVYYVYSQILFYDSNDTVGQSIYVNGQAHFTCTKSNISALAKQSTCYVAGLVRMSAGDTVAIKLSVHSLTVALYADTSYFGLYRVR